MKVECEEILSEIEVYLDGELASARCGEIEQHLADCGPCVDRADFRRRLRDLIARRCGPETVPEGILERIKARLDAN
ncbi:MAG: mycothiol system anti-sigma-R factor [Actinomycetota bacterium]